LACREGFKEASPGAPTSRLDAIAINAIISETISNVTTPAFSSITMHAGSSSGLLLAPVSIELPISLQARLGSIVAMMLPGSVLQVVLYSDGCVEAHCTRPMARELRQTYR
jgi:hypothetical protein